MSETDGIDQWDPLTVWRAVVIDLETVRWSLSEEPAPNGSRHFATRGRTGAARLST